MTDDLLDPETHAQLRSADPLRDLSGDELGGLDTEAALRVVLAAADAQAPSARRVGRPRRRVLALGAAAAVAAGATLAVVDLGSGSGPGGAVAPARAATLVVRVRHALQGTPGGVLEVQSTISKDGSPPAAVHYWQQSAAPHDSVDISSGGGSPTLVTGQHDGANQVYDPATNTIDVETPTPSVQRASGPSARVQAIDLLHRTGVTVTRGATLDGAPAIELVWARPDNVETMYVDPHTYAPLEVRWSLTRNAPDAQSTVIRYELYRTLIGAQAPDSLVSLTAQHPTAAVVRMAPARWNATVSSLGS